MATAHPQIFHDLSEPFDGEVRQRKVGTRQADYITARAVMNRLDKVVGPENWRDEYTPQEHGILCTLSIRMPNGEWVSKSDAGGCAGMSDEADDAKSGYSDAFKRAAVKWGIGRHLYGEGIPRFLPEYDGPRDKHQFATYLKAIDPDQSKGYVEWIKEWGVKQGHPAKIAEWTPEHVMTAYPVLYKHIESDTK
ncbi:MAG: hypothetical protein KGL39_27335 [Patescibacteria group bacterium]|nr:hypothetical protein [Patescibacteria group bacterium]